MNYRNIEMKYLIILSTLLIISCGSRVEKLEADGRDYEEICVDGVLYITYRDSITVKYDTDGTIIQCLN